MLRDDFLESLDEQTEVIADSWLYQAEKKGLEKGLEKGLKQGIERGVKKGEKMKDAFKNLDILAKYFKGKLPVSEEILLDLLKESKSSVEFVEKTVTKYTARTAEKKIKQFFLPDIDLTEEQQKEFRGIVASFYKKEEKQ